VVRPLVCLELDAAWTREFVRRAGCDNLAAEQDRDTVADQLDLGEQMRVQKHGHATAAQLLEEQTNGTATDRVQRGRRLVEQQDGRVAYERLRKPETLLHPLRHPVDATVRRLGERDQIEQPLSLSGATTRTSETLVQLEHLIRGVPARETKQFSQIAERATRDARAGARTRDPHLTRTWPHQPNRDLHQRRLARPIRPKQTDKLALANVEVNPLQRLDNAITLAKPTNGEHSRHLTNLALAKAEPVSHRRPSRPSTNALGASPKRHSRTPAQATACRRGCPPGGVAIALAALRPGEQSVSSGELRPLAALRSGGE
jgi:hypothetical protein